MLFGIYFIANVNATKINIKTLVDVEHAQSLEIPLETTSTLLQCGDEAEFGRTDTIARCRTQQYRNDDDGAMSNCIFRIAFHALGDLNDLMSTDFH